MIVRTQDDGSLILVNQTDHAKLSGLFAAHWGNEVFAAPSPRESAIRAATFHDSGWHRYETGPLYDPVAQSSPTFFQVPGDETQLAAFGGAIDWLTEIDPYAGLMINRHRTGLYRSRYGAVQQPVSVSRIRNETRLDAFIAVYEDKQARQLAAFDRRQFLINYQLLQFWDLFSLSLCQREPREEVFESVPVSYDGDGTTGITVTMTPLDGQTIKVDPYPFDEDRLKLGYVSRNMPTRVFADQAAFRLAYFGTAPQLRTFTFTRP